jgi:HEAT repeat protein
MLDATGKKLLRLLQPDSPAEVRAAAALVLGEVGGRDAELARALCERIDDPEPHVRSQAMAAAGKLRVESALPRLLPRIRGGGEEAEIAAQAAARLGTKGMEAVKEVMAQAPPGLKRRLAGALAAGGTPTAETVALDALLDKDPGVVDAAIRSLIGEVPSFSPAHRTTLADHALELLAPKKGTSLPLASETALVRLLSALEDPRGEKLFWSRIGPGNPPELRAAALQAIGKLRFRQGKDTVGRLLECALDRNFRVAAPALMILNAVPVPDRNLKDWLPLFDAPDTAARRFAVDKLGDRDDPEVAEALLRQVDHRDRAFREQAIARLAKGNHGRRALVRALVEAASPDEAWFLARAQMPLVREYPAELLRELFARGCDLLEANDRRAEAVLALLREADARSLRDQLEVRAVTLRKKKAYAEALTYFRWLARDPACAEAIRYETAACGLKLSDRDLAAETRANDLCLGQFARLVHSYEVDPVERLRQTKWLETEELFYVGFHFVEGERREREFGTRVLQLVCERSPRSKLAKDAKSKLRSLGLG